MELWHVRFLGVPHATCGEKLAHLRSREAWAVLASLVLPSILRGDSTGETYAREMLADRFWTVDGSVDPRTHLRQCLASIRKSFGPESLICTRTSVRIADGVIESDIGRMIAFQHRAGMCATSEERLDWLLRAVAEVKGEFFEGLTPTGDDAQLWLNYLRADINRRIVSLFLELAETFETRDNKLAALDMVLRALQMEPGHSRARKKAWSLAIITGRQHVVRELEHVESFREAVERLDIRGIDRLSLSDQYRFQDLFNARLDSLPPAVRKAAIRLATIPGRFGYDLAKTVCRVDKDMLERLIDVGLVCSLDECLTMKPIIRECAEKRVTSSTRARQRRRLTLYCLNVLDPVRGPNAMLPPPFHSSLLSEPLLNAAVDWAIQQIPSHELFAFFALLAHRGFINAAQRGLAYVAHASEDLQLPMVLRLEAYNTSYRIFWESGDRPAASTRLLLGLNLAISSAIPGWDAHFQTLLCTCLHHSGDTEAALKYGLSALDVYRKSDCRDGVMDITRVLAEVCLSRHENERALEYCNESLAIRRELNLSPAHVADALYWKAQLLFRCGDEAGAEPMVEEALKLWQQAGDRTGIAFCLKLLARVYSHRGHSPLARSLAEHAVDLHARQGDEPSRIAAVQVLAETLRQSGEYKLALGCYAECIAHYARINRLDHVGELQAERDACLLLAQTAGVDNITSGNAV